MRATFDSDANYFEYDPRYFNVEPQVTRNVMMGDIVQTVDEEMELTIAVVAQAPIERIDVLNGTTEVKTLRPYEEPDLGNRIRIVWQGAVDDIDSSANPYVLQLINGRADGPIKMRLKARA